MPLPCCRRHSLKLFARALRIESFYAFQKLQCSRSYFWQAIFPSTTKPLPCQGFRVEISAGNTTRPLTTHQKSQSEKGDWNAFIQSPLPPHALNSNALTTLPKAIIRTDAKRLHLSPPPHPNLNDSEPSRQGIGYPLRRNKGGGAIYGLHRGTFK